MDKSRIKLINSSIKHFEKIIKSKNMQEVDELTQIDDFYLCNYPLILCDFCIFDKHGICNLMQQLQEDDKLKFKQKINKTKTILKKLKKLLKDETNND